MGIWKPSPHPPPPPFESAKGLVDSLVVNCDGRLKQVVIKYVPYVGDSKRALDEYTSEIFMGGRNTIAMHNTCEDSLLASPLIYDLVILAELCERIQVREGVPRAVEAVPRDSLARLEGRTRTA